MYHLPPKSDWNPELLVAALLKRGLQATRSGDNIHVTLPIAEMDLRRLGTDALSPCPQPAVIGETVAEISYSPATILGNIRLKLPNIERYPTTYFARTKLIREAMLECGYDCGSERELAKRYSPSDVHQEIETLLNEVEKLDRDKFHAIEEGRFVDASETLARQMLLRKQLK